MNQLADVPVVVVGGGFGGLSAACYLAKHGADVTLLEKNEQLGGRASTLERDGFRFDMGPSWYLMPDVFERFFAAFDHQPSEFYQLDQLDPHYRVNFTDGDSIDVDGDIERMKGIFERYETGAGEAFERYLETSEHTYTQGMEQFVYEDRARLRDYISLEVLRNARGLNLLGTMDDHVASYFSHPKLQQLVQYSLVFLGGSPQNTPALYNLMSHVDFNLGVHYPRGGIASVVDGLVELGQSLGVEMRVHEPVEAIQPTEDGMLVRTRRTDPEGSQSSGAVHRAAVVLSDAPYAHTEQELLAPEFRGYDDSYWEERTFAPSALLCYFGVEGDLESLAHHTLVLPTDWDEHFEQIFEEPSWPDDPAYYVCAPSKTDDSVAPDGHSALFVLVPIAAGLPDGPERRSQYRELILEHLAEHADTDIRDRIVLEETFSVSDFADRYNAYDGTALGLAHTLRQTALFRPPHRSKQLDRLYFTGANTTPGIGVPMCLISGEVTTEYILEDWGQ